MAALLGRLYRRFCSSSPPVTRAFLHGGNTCRFRPIYGVGLKEAGQAAGYATTAGVNGRVVQQQSVFRRYWMAPVGAAGGAAVIYFAKDGPNPVSAAVDKVCQVVAVIGKVIAKKASETFFYHVWQNIKSKLNEIWEAIKKLPSVAWEMIKSGWKARWKMIKKLPSVAWEMIKSGMEARWKMIKEYLLGGNKDVPRPKSSAPGELPPNHGYGFYGFWAAIILMALLLFWTYPLDRRGNIVAVAKLDG